MSDVIQIIFLPINLCGQVAAGGPQVFAEYAIVETNCTTTDDDNCVPLNNTVAVSDNDKSMKYS